MLSDGARGVWSEPTSTRLRNEEHVESSFPALSPDLEVAHRASVLFDHPSLDSESTQPFEDLITCERLAVPVASDFRIRVPADEEIGVVIDRGTQRCQVSSHPSRGIARSHETIFTLL
jgi:hypothetical protein